MNESLVWNIVFFESERGEKVVKEFIKSLDKKTISKVASEIDLLEQYGPFLGMPHSKKLVQDLYELRIRGKQEVRILYGFINKNIVLLHAFIKKTQKTPLKEINIASSRFQGLR